MQTDMHYYGTYAMARAGGFRNDIARAIATAAEYVDDSDRVDVVCRDGFEIHVEPTAHHPTDLKHNTDPKDQKRTWVPFHFIPGCEGATDAEKLLCVTDSKVARSVVEHTLDSLDRPFGIPLLGILAHSYVDTFSHYGFSGISSPLNRIDPESMILTCSEEMKSSLAGTWDKFTAKYVVGPLANWLVQLGHGSVATYPDQPYLTWEFNYTSPSRPSRPRENQRTFLSGCRRLHETFVAARAKFNGDHDDHDAYRDFSDIEGAVREVLAVEGDEKARAAAWQRAATSGKIYRTSEPIPAYDSSRFATQLQALDTYDRDFAVTTVVYRFLEAAEFHRDFIVRDLLPKQGIHIESVPVEWHN